jgi:trimeric autotransporter adhesin
MKHSIFATCVVLAACAACPLMAQNSSTVTQTSQNDSATVTQDGPDNSSNVLQAGGGDDRAFVSQTLSTSNIADIRQTGDGLGLARVSQQQSEVNTAEIEQGAASFRDLAEIRQGGASLSYARIEQLGDGAPGGAFSGNRAEIEQLGSSTIGSTSTIRQVSLTASFAQSAQRGAGNDSLIVQSGLLKEASAIQFSPDNTSRIEQQGGNSLTSVVQGLGSGSASSGSNTSTVIQDTGPTFDGNFVIVRQTGRGNSSDVLQGVNSTGVRNTVGLQQSGDDNESSILQIGDDNSAMASQSTNGNFSTISQTGTGNMATLNQGH